ncbi:MAG: SpoIIE family protein phosphatase [Gemmataceae bacterium]|nr:SpoIIE family protein phosphatase [Gemmataceae bacterium]
MKAGPRPDVRVLLIDDQAFVGESVRRMVAAEGDIEFHFCADPAEAIATANRVQPTVILQDLVMPEIDGLLLVKFFRANPGTRETPMIVLSSKEEPVIKARAFALGANDYLVKLPDPLELLARIRYHSRAYRNLVERNEAYRQLAESQQELANEVSQAARYVQSLLPNKLKGEVKVDWRFVPSTQLGGDMFGYHWIDSDHFAVYLLDVSGHGVGSSLLAVSASNVLASRALSNTDFREPAEVVSRMNDVFQMDKQNGKYFTIFYGVFNKKNRLLRYCNGAHPSALLFHGESPDTLTLDQLESTDPLIGMLPPGTPFEERSITVGPWARLFLFSDGVFEIDCADGSMWKFPEFLEFLRPLGSADDLMDQLYSHVRELRGGPVLNDDFSILEVRC